MGELFEGNSGRVLGVALGVAVIALIVLGVLLLGGVGYSSLWAFGAGLLVAVAILALRVAGLRWSRIALSLGAALGLGAVAFIVLVQSTASVQYAPVEGDRHFLPTKYEAVLAPVDGQSGQFTLSEQASLVPCARCTDDTTFTSQLGRPFRQSRSVRAVPIGLFLARVQVEPLTGGPVKIAYPHQGDELKARVVLEHMPVGATLFVAGEDEPTTRRGPADETVFWDPTSFRNGIDVTYFRPPSQYFRAFLEPVATFSSLMSLTVSALSGVGAALMAILATMLIYDPFREFVKGKLKKQEEEPYETDGRFK